jgi:hypothetical protein
LRDKYQALFSKGFVKEILIRIVGGLVKDNNATYFSEDSLDFAKIEPSQVFTSLLQFLKDLMRQATKELGLDDEKRVFLGLVVFKERFMMYLLSNTLDILRDILIQLPLSSKASQLDANTKRL